MMPPLESWGPAIPDWVPTAAAAVVLLAGGLLMLCRRAGWLSGIGPQAVVALGGVAVSVYGLWGFATDTAGLPVLLAVAFIGVFDAAEMVLLVMLYRTADPAVGWTRELRLMHRTAWLLVTFSALMNAVHAPNWYSRPVLAAIPALATWLIELQLRAKLHTEQTDQESEEEGRPGPVRLVVLLWQRCWSGIFAALGLDARTSSSALARAALVQRAALRVYRLRLALEAGTRPRRVRTLRRRAQTALDRADVATDPQQSLALARRLAALVRADEVAQLDYTNTRAVLEMVEELSVTDAAAADVAVSRAEEAEAARRRSEDARQEVERARQRSADDLAAIETTLAELREEEESARQRVTEAQQEEEAARQRSEGARQEAEDARQRSVDARQRAERDEGAAQQHARKAVEELEEEAGRLRGTIEMLHNTARDTQRETRQAQDVLSQIRTQVSEAQAVRDRLLGELAQHAPTHDPDAVRGLAPLFQSEAKQAGWEEYARRLDASAGQDELTAGELAERYGVAVSNARNWLRDFRAARAAQFIEREPSAAEREPSGVERASSGAEREPSADALAGVSS